MDERRLYCASNLSNLGEILELDTERRKMKGIIVLAVGMTLIASVASAQTQRNYIFDSRGKSVGFFTTKANGQMTSETWTYPEPAGFSDFRYGYSPFGSALPKRTVSPDEKGWVPLWMRIEEEDKK